MKLKRRDVVLWGLAVVALGAVIAVVVNGGSLYGDEYIGLATALVGTVGLLLARRWWLPLAYITYLSVAAMALAGLTFLVLALDSSDSLWPTQSEQVAVGVWSASLLMGAALMTWACIRLWTRRGRTAPPETAPSAEVEPEYTAGVPDVIVKADRLAAAATGYSLLASFWGVVLMLVGIVIYFGGMFGLIFALGAVGSWFGVDMSQSAIAGIGGLAAFVLPLVALVLAFRWIARRHRTWLYGPFRPSR